MQIFFILFLCSVVHWQRNNIHLCLCAHTHQVKRSIQSSPMILSVWFVYQWCDSNDLFCCLTPCSIHQEENQELPDHDPCKRNVWLLWGLHWVENVHIIINITHTQTELYNNSAVKALAFEMFMISITNVIIFNAYCMLLFYLASSILHYALKA